MLERFSLDSHNALAEAAKQAAQQSADAIAPNHLLLALLAAPTSVAGVALTQATSDKSAARRRVTEGSQALQPRRPGRLLLSADLLRIIEAAEQYRVSVRADFVTTGHLLRVTLEDRGIATESLLREAGVDVSVLSRMDLTSSTEPADVIARTVELQQLPPGQPADEHAESIAGAGLDKMVAKRLQQQKSNPRPSD